MYDLCVRLLVFKCVFFVFFFCAVCACVYFQIFRRMGVVYVLDDVSCCTAHIILLLNSFILGISVQHGAESIRGLATFVFTATWLERRNAAVLSLSQDDILSFSCALARSRRR